MRDLVLKHQKIVKTETYKFRFEPYGWAIITLDENAGMVNICSDWGIGTIADGHL